MSVKLPLILTWADLPLLLNSQLASKFLLKPKRLPERRPESCNSAAFLNLLFTSLPYWINKTSHLFPTLVPITQMLVLCRTRAPPSLPGLWRRESLLLILALLYTTHSTRDVSTFRTLFSDNYSDLLDLRGTKPAHQPAHGVGTRLGQCCKTTPNQEPARPGTALGFFLWPPDLKIAGNSIFIFLSKNFFPRL